MSIIKKNISFKMKFICLKENLMYKKEWQEVDPSFNVIIHYGEKFGILSILFKCECCEMYSFYDYFFTISDHDYIYSKCMKPKFLNNKLELNLPNGDLGQFDVLGFCNDDLNDSYIIKILSYINEITPDENSLNILFRTIHNIILMRTMFKKLYFRCFRKSFAPNKRQAISRSGLAKESRWSSA